MSPLDILTRFTFSDISYRGEVVRLDKTYQEVLNRYKYPPPVAKLLGESLAAISLISATIKFKGKVSLQLQGGQNLPLLFVEANHNGQLRGLAHWNNDVAKMDFNALTQGGILAINLMPEKTNNYQGIVSLDGDNLASCLNNYFLQSEQLRTGFWLVTDSQKAAGLFLQEFPAANQEDKALWTELELLSNTISTKELIELPVESILSRLYAEHTMQVFEPTPIEFNCPCSEEKAFNSVMMLADEEIQDLIKLNEKIDSNCEFCRAEYSFGKEILYAAIMKRSENSKQTH